MRIRIMMLAALATASVAACHHDKASTTTTTTTTTTGDKTLYDRLGGQDAIGAVVDDFVGNVAADARINTFFANADIKHLKAMLKDQICAATGGPCKYTGKDMKTSHAGMGVKETDFNALVEDLKKSLDKFKVGDKEQGELLGALGGMKGDIVTK